MNVARMRRAIGRGAVLAPGALVAALAFSLTPAAHAATFTWADWNSETPTGPNSGVVLGDFGGTGISITYSGEVQSSTQVGDSGSDYWTADGGQDTDWYPAYISPTVSNAPLTTDMIGIDGLSGNTDTFTFSSPIVDPVMDLISLGGATTVTYTFDAPFVLLSQGPAHFGGSNTALTQPAANEISGTEGDGTLEFLGTFSSLTFVTGGNPEFWNGFSLGIQGAASAAPEPGSLALLGAGLLPVGAALLRRRNRRAA